jgi:hypothetical protein
MYIALDASVDEQNHSNCLSAFRMFVYLHNISIRQQSIRRLSICSKSAFDAVHGSLPTALQCAEIMQQRASTQRFISFC